MERRELLKQAWIPPAILTLPVLPSFARAGSDDVRGNVSNEQWTVTLTGYYVPGQPTTFFSQGSYQILPPGGQTYVLNTNWTYIGVYGVDAQLPSTFPLISLAGVTGPIGVSPR